MELCSLKGRKMRITAGQLANKYNAMVKANPKLPGRVVAEQYANEIRSELGYDVDDDGYKIINKKKQVFHQKQISILDLGEAICGRETLRKLYDNGPRVVSEEVGGGALGPSQFAAINAWLGATDGLLGAELMEHYTYAIEMARVIVKWEMDVRFQENKRIRYSIPQNAPTDDLEPGQELPSGDLRGEFVRHRRMEKQGESLGVTWEASHFDQTQSLMEAAGMMGTRFGITIDERVLRAVFGIGLKANSYKYNDVNTNTYLLAGAYVNQLNNALLTEAKSLDTAEQLLLKQTDPATGLEIDVRKERYIITVPALRLTAFRLQNPISGSLQVGSLTADDRYNTLNYITDLKVHWSQRLPRLLSTANGADYAAPLSLAQANTRWVYGDTQRAFVYRSAKDITTYRYSIAEAPQLAKRDVLMEIDVTEMGAVSVIEPRFCVLNYDSTIP